MLTIINLSMASSFALVPKFYFESVPVKYINCIIHVTLQVYSNDY